GISTSSTEIFAFARFEEKRTFKRARLRNCGVNCCKRKVSRTGESEKSADRAWAAWQKAGTRVAKETEPWR
ncbi:MAG TPA: hypothetical protein VI412_07820, partial [Tabrizicola sp.]